MSANRLQNRVRDIPLKAKFIIVTVVFFCLPFLIFGLIWNTIAGQTIERNAVEPNQLLLGQINDRLNRYFFDLEKESLSLLAHPLVVKFLSLDGRDAYELFSISNQMAQLVFPSIAHSRADVYNFTILNSNGLIAASNSGPNNEERFMELMGRIGESEHFKIVDVDWLDSIPILTVARRIFDMSSRTTKGMFFIDLKIYEVSSFFKGITLGDSGFISISDANGKIVYSPSKDRFGLQVSPEWYDQLLTNKQGFFVDETSGVKTLITFNHSPVTNWYVIAEVPLHELTGNLLYLRNITVLFSILLLLLAFILFGGFSLTITKALLRLQKMMKRAEMGDLRVVAPEHKYYIEIHSLYRGFNQMVLELNRLIEAVHSAQLNEKEAQLRQRDTMIQVMQSQINPHFLHNTLEIINSYAIVQGVEPISRMATALSDLFRYSANNTRTIVTLQEELSRIKTYLSIQRIRFEKLKVEISIQERHVLKRVRCIRLTLQPIVENAFIHGYEAAERLPEFIAIRGWKEEHRYCIAVSDRGGGMPRPLREQFNRHFSSCSESQLIKLNGDVFPGVGLWNVHKRLRLTFGEPFGLSIARSDETGTDIVVALPIESD